MKRFHCSSSWMLLGSLLASVAATLLVTVTLASPAAAVEINRIVLRVNNRIATLADYERRRNDRLKSLERQNLSAEQRQQVLSRIGELVMQELYEELLLLSRGEQLGIAVSEDQVASSIEESRIGFGIETAEEFEAALAQSGLTLAVFEDQVRTNLLVREVIAVEVRPRVALDDDDLRRFYHDNQELFRQPPRIKLREIVVLENGGLPADELMRTAQELARQAREESSLAELVEIHAGSGLTTELIDVGWVVKGDLGEELESVVWELDAGQVSPPIPARGGLHICEVVERQESSVVAYIDVADDIRNRLGAERMQDELQEYIAEIGDAAYVVSDLPGDALAFEPARGRRDGLEFFDAFKAPMAEVEEAVEAAIASPESAPAVPVATGEDGV